MKIAILGTRGIPANYGGFETLAEQLGTRLAAREHEITVYGRKHYSTISEATYKGINLVILPTIRHKYFDTVIHTLLSVLHAAPRRFDAILICNAANSVFSFVPRLFGTPTLVNVDGLERKRKKWNWVGRKYYLISEWLSTFLPTAIVTDARVIQDYYATRYKKESEMIAYGAEVARRADPEKLLKFGLEPNRYALYVSRLEPENNAHLVIEAYSRVKTDMPLVIVGGAPYADNYIARLKSAKDPRVKFPGFVFGEDYRALQQNAYCYIHATEVGGAHPALIEAMGAGNCALTLATPENMEVIGDAGIVYKSVDDLAIYLQRVIDDPTIISEYRRRAMTRVTERYNWEQITDRYEELLARLAGVEIPASGTALTDPVSYPIFVEKPAHNMNYQSGAKIPLWRPAAALLSEHRGLVRSMVRRDLTNRYKGSIIGLAWAIITPAVMIIIFTVIFSGIFGARFGAEGGHLSFALYLFCGLLPWIAFSDGVQRSTTSLTDNVNLVKRVVFPTEALPVNMALSAIAQQMIGTVVLLAVALILERAIHPTALLLPLLIIPQLLATVGLGWLMASLGVFIRDMPQINQLALTTWMYLTPIFYPENIIPQKYQWMVNLNPMAPLVRSYRRILLEGRTPDWRGLSVTIAFALVCFVFGYWWFQRTKKAFADIL